MVKHGGHVLGTVGGGGVVQLCRGLGGGRMLQFAVSVGEGRGRTLGEGTRSVNRGTRARLTWLGDGAADSDLFCRCTCTQVYSSG